MKVADFIVLYAQGTRQKSYGPILNLPILTDTDSNRFLGILTLPIPIPIPIFIHKYHTDTDFLQNTDTDSDYTDYRSVPTDQAQKQNKHEH